MLACERKAYEVRNAPRQLIERACREQATERLLLRLERLFDGAPAGFELRGRLECRACFLVEGPQRPVRIRYRSFRRAQRIARLAPAGFPRFELGFQGADPRSQRRKVLFAGGRPGRAGHACAGGKERPDQTLALPWADTAATRLAISPASPRYRCRSGRSPSSRS